MVTVSMEAWMGNAVHTDTGVYCVLIRDGSIDTDARALVPQR